MGITNCATDQKTERFWMRKLNGDPEWGMGRVNMITAFNLPIQLQFITWTYWFAFAWMTLQLKGGGLGREFTCLIHINSDSSTSVAGDFLHLYLSFLTLFASVRKLFFCLRHETTLWNIIFLSYMPKCHAPFKIMTCCSLFLNGFSTVDTPLSLFTSLRHDGRQ